MAFQPPLTRPGDGVVDDAGDGLVFVDGGHGKSLAYGGQCASPPYAYGRKSQQPCKAVASNSRGRALILLPAIRLPQAEH